MAVFLRKLLRIGGLPAELRAELDAEDIIHLAEYVPVTRRFTGRVLGRRRCHRDICRATLSVSGIARPSLPDKSLQKAPIRRSVLTSMGVTRERLERKRPVAFGDVVVVGFAFGCDAFGEVFGSGA